MPKRRQKKKHQLQTKLRYTTSTNSENYTISMQKRSEKYIFKPI